jgi:N-acetylglutamate synthase-like GNAT family acetyltransferase
MAFRTAVAADIDAIVELVESAYRGESSRRGWTTEADLLDGQRTDRLEVQALLSRDGSEVIVAEASGHITGCCHLERRSPHQAWFGLFSVRPDLQGGGLGHALLSEARKRAAGWGCDLIRMTVIRQRTDLIAWYARRGFLPTGETAPFPYGDERYGRPRRDDLEFLVLEGSTHVQ